MFSALSFNETSLATVTPSLVAIGAPYARSITTVRPLGPIVIFTAFANLSTPADNLSVLNTISFAMI